MVGPRIGMIEWNLQGMRNHHYEKFETISNNQNKKYKTFLNIRILYLFRISLRLELRAVESVLRIYYLGGSRRRMLLL